jgi:hypothetical protein
MTANIQVCHMCRRVSDGSESTERWVTKQVYREITGIDPATCFMMHTYCPKCLQYLSDYRVAA